MLIFKLLLTKLFYSLTKIVEPPDRIVFRHPCFIPHYLKPDFQVQRKFYASLQNHLFWPLKIKGQFRDSSFHP